MALPEPDERLTDDDSESRAAPAPHTERPDWLVGPDEGAASEVARVHGDGGPSPAPLRLIKSGEELPPDLPPPGRPLPAAEQTPSSTPEARRRPVAWTAAASSIPRLKLEVAPTEGRPARKAAPEDVARARKPAPEDAAPARPGARDLEAQGFPDDAPAASGPAARSPLAPLDEPWWIVALEDLRSSSRTQVFVIVALLVAVAAWIFWPHGEPGVSLATIRRHPERFDNQIVRVKGEVGDVFSVGGGYAFSLQQGRDTMVVFTRSRVPASHQNVTIEASVSTGFLDGVQRQALFEVAH